MEDNISYEEMYYAYECCRKKKRSKYSTKKFATNALYNITKLVEEINNRKYKLKPSRCFIVEYPTAREVFCADFRDRVVQHFVYNELNSYMDKCFIFDTANCRKGKGTDFAIKRVSKFIRRETNNYTADAYYLKLDLSGFFMSIDREYLLKIVLDFIDNKYKGEHKEILKYLVEIIILSDCTKNAIKVSKADKWAKLPANKTLFGNKNGLPIGNICSQLFANFYLNNLDHMIKSRHRSMSRYVDDIIIVDSSKEKLQETLPLIKEYLPTISLKLNTRKTKINNVKYGINFLGVVIKPYYTTLGKSRINRVYYASRLFKTFDYAYPRICCRWGVFNNYKGLNLANRWFNTLPNNIKVFIRFNFKEGFVSRLNINKYKLLEL